MPFQNVSSTLSDALVQGTSSTRQSLLTLFRDNRRRRLYLQLFSHLSPRKSMSANLVYPAFLPVAEEDEMVEV